MNNPAPLLSRNLPHGLLRTTLADDALEALALHRVLTLEQLRELLTPRTATTTRWATRMNQLRRAGLVRALSRGARTPKVWCATRAGLRVAVGRAGRRYEVPETGGILVAHTLAVNEVGASFVRAARVCGDECDWRCWEHEVAHSFYSRRSHRLLIADAVLSYTMLDPEGAAYWWPWFVELDRATQPVQKLAAKIRAYAEYHAWRPRNHRAHDVGPDQPAWHSRYHGSWPILCVIIGANPSKTSQAIEGRILQLIRLLNGDAFMTRRTVPVVIGAYEQLVAEGPWAPIWRRPDDPDRPVDANGNHV